MDNNLISKKIFEEIKANFNGDKTKEEILNNFKNYIKFHSELNINDLNSKIFDLLVLALKNKFPFELIKYIVGTCIKYKKSLNYETKEEDVPLFLAFLNAIPQKKASDSFFLINNHIKIFDFLIENGSDINFCNRNGENLLTYIYNKNLLNTDLFKFLYNKRIDINYFLEKLYIASKYSEEENEENNNENFEISEIEEIEKKKHRNNFIKYLKVAVKEYHNYEKKYALMLIQNAKNKIKISNEQLNNLYKEYIIDVGVKIPFDYFYDLYESKQYDTIETLIDNQVGIYYNNFTKEFCKSANPAIIEYLKKFDPCSEIFVKHFYIKDIIQDCLYNEDYAMSDFFIDQGIDLDYFDVGDHYSRTLFIDECHNGNINSVKYLTERGADITIKNNFDGISGLRCFLYYKPEHVEILKYLLDHGADFFNDYFLCLNQLKEKDINFYNYLLEYGLNIYQELKNNYTNYSYSKYLLDYSTYFNPKDFCVPINNYIVSGNLEIIKYLIKRGISPNIVDFSNETIIYNACRIENLEFMKYLKENNADINIDPETDIPILLLACSKKNLDIVKFLIDNGADINKPEYYGKTALIFAMPNLEIVMYLVEHGADVNKADNNGITPLMYASMKGYYDIVEYLIENNAIIDFKSKYYGNAINMSVDDNNWRIYDYLEKFDTVDKSINKITKYELLTDESLIGNLDMVKNYINKGYNINEVDNYGNTALMKASYNGHIEVVKYLVECGADIDIVNNDLYTALMFACYCNHFDIVSYLIDHKASLNNKSSYGITELMISCKKGFYNIVKYLICHGADVNAISTYGYTALMYACQNNDINIVKLLIENNANIEISNSNDYTAILYSSSCNNIELIKYLYDHGGNIKVKSKDGYTTLINSCNQNNFELIKYCVEHDVDLIKLIKIIVQQFHICVNTKICLLLNI